MASKYDFCKYKTIADSLKLYQQGKFGNLNCFLWQKKLHDNSYITEALKNVNTLREVAKDTINLSSITQTSPNNITLFRGDNSSHFDMEQFIKGSVIPLKGFTSTSEDYNVAKSFTNTDKSNCTGIIFEIKVPKGGKFISITDAEFSFEQETLLPPANYEVLDVSKTNGGKYYITLEQKQILNVSTLIDEGLNHISSNLSNFSWHKKSQINRLKNQVHKYIDYLEKNPTITILSNSLPPHLTQNDTPSNETTYNQDNNNVVHESTPQQTSNSDHEMEM